MFPLMLRGVRQLKVLRAVVSLVPVPVMDHLAPAERTAQELFHHETVLTDPTPVPLLHDVAPS
jgi:hypothetical protein